MRALRRLMGERWSALGVAARLWWTGLAAVALAGVLVLAATTVTDASSHPAPKTTSGPQSTSSDTGRDAGPMAGMAMGGSPTTPSTTAVGSTQTTSGVCGNVKGATTMADGMVMAPVPSGAPTATQQAAADQLVAETAATLSTYANLSAATAAGYTPATNPNGHVVHYAKWQVAKTDGFDAVRSRFLGVRQHRRRRQAPRRHVPRARAVHAWSRRRRPAHSVARP